MSIDVAGIGFSDPVPLVNAALPCEPGLFVLLVAQGHGDSRGYQPVCGGQADSLAGQLRLTDECVRRAFREHPSELLYVATHPFAGNWSPGERMLLEMRVQRFIEPRVTETVARHRQAPGRIAAAYR